MVNTVTLTNGITVILENNPYVRTISFGIWIKNGSVDETEIENGLSHFIEHMLFKGTHSRTNRDIADEMAAIGGRINAFTAKEYMCYYAHVLENHFDVAIDVLSDMICHSKFDLTDIEKEKKVVIEELNMYEDSPEDVVNDGLQEAVWQDHPIGRNIIGTKELILNFTQADILDYMKRHYVGTNMVLSVTGAISDEAALIEVLEEKFKTIKKGDAVQRAFDVTYHPSFKTFEKDIEQAHICIAFPTVSYLSEDHYQLTVANTMIGGGINSRLFQSIREDQGLAYSVYSYYETYTHGGLFVIYAATAPDQLLTVTQAILEEIDLLVANGFDGEELERSKAQIQSNLIIGLEGMNARMSSYGKSKLMRGVIRSQDEIIESIACIQTEMLWDFIKQTFNYANMSVTLVSPEMKELTERVFRLWEKYKCQ